MTGSVKLLGTVIMVAGCGMVGAMKAKKLCDSVKTIEALIHAFETLEAELSMYMKNVYECCQAAALRSRGEIKALFAACGSFSTEERFEIQWRMMLMRRSLNVPDDVLEELLLFGGYFGKYDVSQQLSSLSRTKARLEEYRKEAQERYKQVGKLYRTVGVMVGLMTGIVLL